MQLPDPFVSTTDGFETASFEDVTVESDSSFNVHTPVNSQAAIIMMVDLAHPIRPFLWVNLIGLWGSLLLPVLYQPNSILSVAHK